MELDTKLELFKSINESTVNLSNIVEKYRDALSSLATETSNLGCFLRDCGKNSSSSGSVMVNTGKVISYLGQQYFTAMSSLTRTLQELNTFKRAVIDSKETIQVMEKERTEYRASLALMKSCSADIDPDSGRGLEKFRTSQKYVKFAKQKFDKYSLACLQKIDLLAAARCNLFSYSLAAYQTNWIALSEKNNEVLEAHIQIIEKEPKTFQNFGVLKDLNQENGEAPKNKEEIAEKINLNDDDQKLFFGEEFSDGAEKEKVEEEKLEEKAEKSSDQKLIDYDGFDEFMSASSNILLPSQLLMDDNFYNMPTNADLLGSLVPSQANDEGSPLMAASKEENSNSMNKNPSKKSSDVSKWFQLFSELDPLNQQQEVQDASDNMYAA